MVVEYFASKCTQVEVLYHPNESNRERFILNRRGRFVFRL
jgi:hypothetical protein